MKQPETQTINLNNLIQRIQSEGVDAAEKKSDEIIRKTKERASLIIADAKKKAQAILQETEEEIRKRAPNSNKAIELAARDLALNIHQSLIRQFESLIKKECRQSMSGIHLKDLLARFIEAWTKNRDQDLSLEIFCGEGERDALFEKFLERFQKELQDGIELKFHPDIEAGFRIGFKEENLYYDFTDETIADALAEYLSPKIRNLFGQL
jgi:V/A-type H+-transporting ATPase subunit E